VFYVTFRKRCTDWNFFWDYKKSPSFSITHTHAHIHTHKHTDTHTHLVEIL